MRVLLLVHDYLPDHVGGTELHAHDVAAALRARGHEVLVLATERDLTRAPGSVRDYEVDGVPVREVVHQREYADVAESWEQPESLEAFERELRAFAPDVVHAHHVAFWGPRCLSRARAHGAAVVMTLHDYFGFCDDGTTFAGGEPCGVAPGLGCGRCLAKHPLRAPRWGGAGDAARALAAAERLAFFRGELSAVQRALSPSRHVAEQWSAFDLLSRTCVEVLPFGVPGDLAAPRRAPRGTPLRVGYVGGLYPAKGAHVLVEACGSLPAGSVALSIHGALDWFPDYVSELRAAAAGHAVRFAGRFDPRDAASVFAELDLVVVPSLWPENAPLVVGEAHRAGLAVVASDVGGVGETLGGGGALVPPGDAEALARTLAELAADREHLDTLAASRPERGAGSFERAVARLEAVYALARAERGAAGSGEGGSARS